MAIESWEDIKKLPLRYKVIGLVFLYAILSYFFWFFIFQSAWEEKARLQTLREELNNKIAAQERVVAQRERYLREIAVLNEKFQTALLKLPERKEIPALLESVGQQGKISGLEFVLFEPIPPPPPPALEQKPPPKKEEGKTAEAVKEDFYETIQINMTVSGSFFNIVQFFDRVAGLQRIINPGQITVSDWVKTGRGAGSLTASSVIKTYMFKPAKSEIKKDKTDEKRK